MSNSSSQVADLLKALEAGMYYSWPIEQKGLRTLLFKLNIKSSSNALVGIGGINTMLDRATNAFMKLK